MQQSYKSNLKKICGTWDSNIRSLVIEYQVIPLHHSSFCDRRANIALIKYIHIYGIDSFFLNAYKIMFYQFMMLTLVISSCVKI
jgi:hypothetical protein